ncbi:MAG: hypothetical protein JSW47_00165 [Phycisphaerales bacterium]|nr:MAG: hypothetical protein JSW47_00165 [Phycisphaerales bacterium]
MTIQFNCPNCNAVIAFDDKHRGKRAKCTTCGQRFMIPFTGGEKVRKVKLTEEKGEAVPGFYRAVFVDSWKLFTRPENVTGLVFIATAVCAKFLVAGRNYTMTIPGRAYSVDLPMPIGHVLHVAAWGFLFWYYMEITYSTAFGRETLPEVIVGGFKGLVALIARSVYVCFVALLVAGLPLMVYVVISEITEARSPVLCYLLVFTGIFLLPMAIVTLAVGKDLTMLRPDYFLITISRAFAPYLVTVMLLGVAGAIQTQADQYARQGVAAATGHLLLNITVQVFALVAMRSIGLFYRHYGSCFAW